MDPGSTPGGIRAMHRNDEITNLSLNARSSRRPRAAFPEPVEAEALSVPADHGPWADEEESLTPSRPKPRKPGPEHPVGGLKGDAPSGALALKDEQLVAKRENLGLELRARPQQRLNRSQKSQKGRARHRKHVDPARRKHQSFQCGREFRKVQGLDLLVFTGGSVNGPRRCGGKHKRWRG